MIAFAVLSISEIVAAARFPGRRAALDRAGCRHDTAIRGAAAACFSAPVAELDRATDFGSNPDGKTLHFSR